MAYPHFSIPIVECPSSTANYKSVPVNLQDHRSCDKLVSLGRLGMACQSYYARIDGGNAPYNRKIEGSLSQVWARRPVAERLLIANERLQQFGVEVFVWDGYRSIETQKGLWSFFWQKSLELLPGATDEQRRLHVLNYVSDPMSFDRLDPRTWPVHSTGGAVDLTLRDLETRELLDMGASFDEMDEVSHSDFYERALQARLLDSRTPALLNRRLLHWAMDSVGFVNYPLEFWHFDWGDQMYIQNLRNQNRGTITSAWYGYIDPPFDGPSR